MDLGLKTQMINFLQKSKLDLLSVDSSRFVREIQTKITNNFFGIIKL